LYQAPGGIWILPEKIEDVKMIALSAVAQVAGEIASLMAIATAGLRMPLFVNNQLPACTDSDTTTRLWYILLVHCYNGEHQSPNRKTLAPAAW